MIRSSLIGAFLVFLVLKLTNVLTWSWWWITAPIWGGIAIWVLVWILIVVFAVKWKIDLDRNYKRGKR